MELSKQKIKQILDSSSYTNLINNKTFHSLKDFVKENNICDFNYLIQTVKNVKQIQGTCGSFLESTGR